MCVYFVERLTVNLPAIHAIVGQSLEIHPRDLIPENLKGLPIAGVTLNSEQAGVIFQAAGKLTCQIMIIVKVLMIILTITK